MAFLESDNSDIGGWVFLAFLAIFAIWFVYERIKRLIQWKKYHYEWVESQRTISLFKKSATLRQLVKEHVSDPSFRKAYFLLQVKASLSGWIWTVTWVFALVGFFYFVSLPDGTIPEQDNVQEGIWIVAFILFGVAALLDNKVKKLFKSNTKVIDPLLKKVYGEKTFFDRANEIPASLLNQYGFPFAKSYDCSGKRGINGIHHGIAFHVADEKLSTGSGDDETTYFIGNIMVIPFPTHSQHPVLVTSDERFHWKESVEIHTESLAFNARFKVYGVTEVDAFRQMSPALILKLSKWKNTGMVALWFNGNYLFVYRGNNKLRVDLSPFQRPTGFARKVIGQTLFIPDTIDMAYGLEDPMFDIDYRS